MIKTSSKLYCSLDIETSGFDPLKNEVLEVGFVVFEFIKGKITKKYELNGENLVDVDAWSENQRGEVTAPAHGTVILPIKAPKKN